MFLQMKFKFSKKFGTVDDVTQDFSFFELDYYAFPVLRSEIPSGIFAKLRTEAASNNRDHPMRSLSSLALASTINCSPGSQALLEVTQQDHSNGITLACSRHTDIFVFFAYISFVVNHTINATPPERLQQHPLLFTTNHTDHMFFL